MGNKTADRSKSWIKPELVRLGTLREVAGPTGTGLQAGGGGQFRT